MLRGTSNSGRGSLAQLVERALSLADQEGDDDDLRLRKRIGVASGYVTIAAPLILPVLAQGHPVAVVLGFSLSAFSALNLLILARTRRFERYVVALISAATIFVTITAWVGGGVTVASSGLIWGFLVPTYALLALGPTRAVRWYWVFVGVVLVTAALELSVGLPFPPEAFEVQLISSVVNVIAPLTVVFGLLLYGDRRRRQAEARSNELLTNAIPVSIATRLRHGEQRIAERYPDTTVLFTDLTGFTAWSQGTEPERVVSVLDDLFSRFDAVVTERGVEKIKTIGNSYMAVSGAPLARSDHAHAAVATALEMLATAAAWQAQNDVQLGLRVGLASGPVVGGVIGQQRILFDLWGDTVNTAQRMESAGITGRIQVSASTWELTRDVYRFEARELDVKGLGPMTAYLVQPD